MTDSGKILISGLIRDKALAVGFDLAGIAPTTVLKEHGEVLSDWCADGMNAGMGYLSRNIEKRINPELLFEGTRSVIVTGLSYYTEKKQGGNGIPVLSRYAYGKNYHDVITEKLNNLLDYIKEIAPGSTGKGFVDSAPILEKAWASRAGLGWQGRHSILVNRQIGSFFFLGILLTDLELSYDEPVKEDHCGSCRLCIEACPTGAINGNRTLNACECIAYQTIDSEVPMSEDYIKNIEGRIYGCDKCQEVCPWNKNATHHKTPEFELDPEVIRMTAIDWRQLSKEDFKRLFGRTPMSRRKYEIFIRNVTNVTKSSELTDKWAR